MSSDTTACILRVRLSKKKGVGAATDGEDVGPGREETGRTFGSPRTPSCPPSALVEPRANTHARAPPVPARRRTRARSCCGGPSSASRFSLGVGGGRGVRVRERQPPRAGCRPVRVVLLGRGRRGALPAGGRAAVARRARAGAVAGDLWSRGPSDWTREVLQTSKLLQIISFFLVFLQIISFF